MRLLSVLAIAILATASIAEAQARSRYDLPSQPLADSLRAVGSQANINVLFDPPLVAEHQAPALKGEYTTSQAFTLLLVGTGVTHEFMNDHTVVLAESAATSGGAAPETGERRASRSGKGVSAFSSSERGAASEGFWDRFRLAQAENPAPREGRGTQTVGSQDSVRRDALEEVVVTAQKRSELLVDVPQSVTVLSGDDLAKLGAVQFADFATRVPGLSFLSQGAGFTQVTLRGVTAGTDLGPTVGIYLDEVPYGSSSSLTFSGRLPLDVGLFDIDRIEVLRGPQGTLYGASSMGGLIKYVTRSPRTTTFGADVQAGMWSTENGGLSYNAAATVNAPVADNVAVRANGFYSRNGGFVDNIALDQKDVDRSEVVGGRLDALFTPTEALSVRVTGFLQDITRDGKSVVDYSTQQGVPIDGPYDHRRLVPEPFDQRFRLLSATVNYDLGAATLTSISAYQTVKTDFITDNPGRLLSAAGAPYSRWSTFTNQTTDRFTQELRVASEGKRPLEWLVGAFYSNEDTDVHQHYDLIDRAGQPAPNPFYDFTSPTTVKETAGFGDLTWYLTDKLDVTGGIRYARNRGTFETIGSGSEGVPRALTPSSENVTTYLANARYHFGNSATGYLRYATGYRPGGPNFTVFDRTTGELAGPEAYEADELSSYEVGFKAETADRHFGIDVAGYYIDWENIQVAVFQGGAVFRTNATGGAEVRGGEVSLVARPIRNLTLAGNFAYTDAKLSQSSPGLGTRSGERLPNVPRNTVSLNADYEFLGVPYRPTVGATYRYVSDRPAAFGATAYQLPEYSAVDLRAGMVLGRVSLQFYVHNVGDKQGQTGISQTSAGLPGVTLVSLLQPRTIGFTATTSF